MTVYIRAFGLMVVMALAQAEDAFAQVTFQPTGCEFRVWFVTDPIVTTAILPLADGSSVETMIAELNLRLDDGYAHYFRAECTLTALALMPKEDMIGDMTELARMNNLEDAKIWIEELSSGQMVGRVRASLNSGQRVYHLDIRRYVGENSILDMWAGAERFPTEGIVMFFKSVAYRGRLLNQ